MLYLAEKTGKLLSGELRERHHTLQWLFWQSSGLGPMLGQNHHFTAYAPQTIPYAIERYQVETQRLYGVLNRRLENHRGWEVSITASQISPAGRGSTPMNATGSTRHLSGGEQLV